MPAVPCRGKTWDKDIADRVFDIFADEVANPSRPLYFHTDDIRLRSLFKELRGKLRGQPANYMPNILPFHVGSGLHIGVLLLQLFSTSCVMQQRRFPVSEEGWAAGRGCLVGMDGCCCRVQVAG